jgi:hypothetical protein
LRPRQLEGEIAQGAQNPGSRPISTEGFSLNRTSFHANNRELAGDEEGDYDDEQRDKRQPRSGTNSAHPLDARWCQTNRLCFPESRHQESVPPTSYIDREERLRCKSTVINVR